MIILLWLCMILFPVMSGLGIMTIIYSKNQEYVIGFADCFLCGWIACIGVAMVAHISGLLAGFSLAFTGKIFLGLLLILALVSAFTGGFGVLKGKCKYFMSGTAEKVPLGLPLGFLGLFSAQIMYVYCMEPVVVPGDITLETVQSFLAQDGIYKVLPLTGSYSESGIPMRYAVLCLPTLYAVLVQKTGLKAALIVCHMVPVIVLGLGYLSYFRLSESLFGKKNLRKRYGFLLIVALVFLFSDHAVFLDGYGALHAGYTGTTARNLILVPLTISAMLERRYWKAILCILAEASIVWTFWGCGVCVVITLGMLILEIFERKNKTVGKWLQIFCQKEEQP